MSFHNAKILLPQFGTFITFRDYLIIHRLFRKIKVDENLDFKNDHPFLALRENGAKYPEMKNMVGIINISVIRFRIPDKSFFEGSSTIHTADKKPLRS